VLVPGPDPPVTRRPFFDPAEGRGFRVWSGVMMCAIVFSFVFNFRDAAIYVGHMEG
jgi:hypothetical protein